MPNKTWLITGCSTGFGRVLAEKLLAHGENVVATARRPETLSDLVKPHGNRALALKLDVTQPEDIENAISAISQQFERIDVLVNNAGYGQMGTVEDAPIETARAQMETNFFGPLALIKAVLPQMIERRSGQIVNIGSIAGQVGFPALSHYCASKFALSGLSESLAAELAPLGIHVTLAELGPFATEFANSLAVVPTSPHYDLAALSQEAGNARWTKADDPELAVEVLLDALSRPSPPRRFIISGQGLEVADLHTARRNEERERWLSWSRMEVIEAQ